ncbi:GNAT family N-acetyltransferase [Virgibacillus salidurans]|uniref:GNAT family N-acetyltransferase n=1 Tax=Virgibacillus salidurans TaxID=2831673 RepID=UPI00351D6A45
MLHFDKIDLIKDRDTVIRFRRDSFVISFGDDSGLGKESEYLDWLEDKIAHFPAGFVLVKENDEPIGQLELSIREYEGENIGYVHLYYLTPKKRGSGVSRELHHYAMQFFKTRNVNEFHLRVATGNTNAIKFYIKNGMQKVGPELDGKVFRMKGIIDIGV